MTNTVKVSNVNTLAKLVTEFTKEGLAFTVVENGKDWVIEITGY